MMPARAPTGRRARGARSRASICARSTPDAFAAIHRAWLDHQVLLFRDQELTDDDLVAFSRRFGDLDEAPVQETGQRFVEGHPEIYVVSNVVQDGVPIGSLGVGRSGVAHRHVVSCRPAESERALCARSAAAAAATPASARCMPRGTSCPTALQRRVEGLRVKHDGTYNSGGYARQGVTPTDDPRTSPGTFHPLVSVHPETGRRGLYLGRRRNAYIDGLSLDESDALLDEIWAQATRDVAHLAAPVAGRRSRALGQPLHDASPRRLRSGGRAA